MLLNHQELLSTSPTLQGMPLNARQRGGRGGGADLHKIPLIKEASDLLNDFCPGVKDLSHMLVIDNAIQVSLSIPRFLV